MFEYATACPMQKNHQKKTKYNNMYMYMYITIGRHCTCTCTCMVHRCVRMHVQVGVYSTCSCMYVCLYLLSLRSSLLLLCVTMATMTTMMIVIMRVINTTAPTTENMKASLNKGPTTSNDHVPE